MSRAVIRKPKPIKAKSPPKIRTRLEEIDQEIKNVKLPLKGLPLRLKIVRREKHMELVAEFTKEVSEGA